MEKASWRCRQLASQREAVCRKNRLPVQSEERSCSMPLGECGVPAKAVKTSVPSSPPLSTRGG